MMGEVMKTIFKSIIITVILLILVAGGIHYFGEKVFYVNNTPSTARGIYVWIPSFSLKKGDMMIMKLPRKYGKMKKDDLFLKHIAGVPGDTYVVTDDYLEIDGVKYPLQKQSFLPQQWRGNYTISDYKYLMLNEAPDSFDGRYFGVVHHKYLLKRVIMFLNFEKVNEYYLAYKKFDGTVWVRTLMKGEEK